MLFRLLSASLIRRFRQLALIAVAITVAAATVSTLATFSRRAEASLSVDLQAFGPNLTVRPQVGAPNALSEDAVARIRRLGGVLAVEKTAAANTLGVRAEPAQVSRVAAAIENAVAGVEARPLLRVAESDAAVARRVSRVLAVIAVLALASALVAVGSATTALVGERRSEIALLFALGCTTERAVRLFAAELLTVAAIAALLGQTLGLLAANVLSARILGGGAASLGITPFGAGLATSGAGFAAAVGVAVATVGLALAVSFGRIAAVDPARVLKGE